MPDPYRTVTRRLRVLAEDSRQQQISAACAAHVGSGSTSRSPNLAKTP